MKKIFLTLCIICPAFTFAQDISPEDPFPKYQRALSFLPQYVGIYGIRMDYERKLANGAHWLVFAPQYYYGQTDGLEWYDELKGAGLNTYFKKFVYHYGKLNYNKLFRTNIYVQAGPTFQYFNLKSSEQYPEEYRENGVTYIRFNTQDINTKVYKVGLNIDFGMQFMFDQFLMDFYLGIGYRHAFDNHNILETDSESYWLDPTYTGVLLDGGVRFGFMMK